MSVTEDISKWFSLLLARARVVPYDPVTLLTVVILMGGISTLVGFLPARRASRMNPIETLRYE